MILVEVILALGGLLGTIGFGRALNALGAFLGTVAEGGLLVGDAAVTAGLAAYPYVRRAVFAGLAAVGIGVALIALGITFNTPLPIFMGGMVIWLVLVIFFGAAWTLGLAVRLVNHVGEIAANWVVGGARRILAAAGLGEPPTTNITLVPMAAFEEQVRTARRASYTVLWLVVAALLVFPFWSTTLVLLPALAGLYILAAAIAHEYGFDTKPLWRILYRIAIPVAAIGLVLAFLFPNTAGVIRERKAHFDEWMRCGLESIGPGVDSVECKQRALRKLGHDMDESFARGERELKKFAVRGVASQETDVDLAPDDSAAPQGAPPTPPTPPTP